MSGLDDLSIRRTEPAQDKPEPKAAPLLTMTERQELARRVLDLALQGMAARLQDDPAAVSASTYAEAVKLLSLWERHYSKAAEQEEAKRRMGSTRLPETFPDSIGETAPPGIPDLPKFD